VNDEDAPAEEENSDDATQTTEGDAATE